jgi:protein-disulfide isomerase
MKLKKEASIAIILSLIALILSAYAVFSVVGPKKDKSKDEETTFKTDVYKVIDAYIAEKSGQPTGPVDVSIKGAAVQGKAKAPVTIVEFSDFECPFCGRYIKETYPQILKKYVDTGKVKYVFRHFPLPMHANAAGAANAAECVREQGGDKMFFEYHDTLYANQSDLSVPKLKEYASKLDIDQQKFAACVDGNKFADAITKDFTEGGKYGVRGTPAFFINGMPLSGAQPIAAFEAAIDEALKK